MTYVDLNEDNDDLVSFDTIAESNPRTIKLFRESTGESMSVTFMNDDDTAALVLALVNSIDDDILISLDNHEVH
jgi:hypothetical protein